MGIFDLILPIAFVGFLVWLVLQLPMPAPFKNVIIGVAIFGLILYVLSGFGLIHGFHGLKLK